MMAENESHRYSKIGRDTLICERRSLCGEGRGKV